LKAAMNACSAAGVAAIACDPDVRNATIAAARTLVHRIGVALLWS
jgi:hypothetical protein